MRQVGFRSRDFVIAFVIAIPLGALAAAVVGALSTWASPLWGVVTVVAAILGLVLGPLAAVGALIGYAIARRLNVRSRWIFSILVASASGIAMVLVLVLITASEMSSFVSETIDGHPSNPWLDALPAFPALFAAGFIPAFVAFFGFASHRMTHPLAPAAPAAVPAQS